MCLPASDLPEIKINHSMSAYDISKFKTSDIGKKALLVNLDHTYKVVTITFVICFSAYNTPTSGSIYYTVDATNEEGKITARQPSNGGYTSY